MSIAVDNQGNIFVGDQGNFSIRKITAGGEVSTFAGSSVNTVPFFGNVFGLATDQQGNLFACDSYVWVREITPAEPGIPTCTAGELRSSIKKITPAGVVSLYARQATYGQVDGGKDSAKFVDITGLAMDPYGNLLVTEGGGDDVRKVTPNGTVTTIAGLPGYAAFADGEGMSAWFNYPTGIAVDRQGVIYVTDNYNQRIRKIVYK